MSRAEQQQGRVLAWSFSRWKTYEDCPRRTYFKVVRNLPDPSGPAAERGTQIHAAGEAYLRAPRAALPAPFKGFPLNRLKRAGAQPEVELAFDRAWRPTEWFAPNAWLRVKVDALLVVARRAAAVVVDYKSGKYRPNDEEYGLQLDLYALAALLLDGPAVDSVVPELWFLDHATIEEAPAPYAREQLPALQAAWEERVEAMMSDKVFAPRPGTGCRWCAFARAAGGPCEFG